MVFCYGLFEFDDIIHNGVYDTLKLPKKASEFPEMSCSRFSMFFGERTGLELISRLWHGTDYLMDLIGEWK